jgi:hypothetical protein
LAPMSRPIRRDQYPRDVRDWCGQEDFDMSSEFEMAAA